MPGTSPSTIPPGAYALKAAGPDADSRRAVQWACGGSAFAPRMGRGKGVLGDHPTHGPDFHTVGLILR